MIKISKRLSIIANMVEDNSNIVDIGCDHGLLDIYLAQIKKNINIIASDINKKALNNAINNIKKYKLSNKIKTIISDGLDNIDTSNTDTIVISGMGSHTIIGILHNNLKKLKNVKTIILQSNNDIDFLRKKMVAIGYHIEDEELVYEKKQIYTIIKFIKGYKFYTNKELYFGPILLKKNNKLFQDKVKFELTKLEKILPLIPKNHYTYRLKTKLKIRRCQKVLKKK